MSHESKEKPGSENFRSPVQPGHCVDGFVYQQAWLVPDAVAVTCAGANLTYAELSLRADRVASMLRHHGVRPEAVVGVLSRRSIEMVTSLLGILRAGGAYLALDPEDPPARYAELLRDAGVDHVLAASSLRDKLPPGRVLLDIGSLPDEEVPERAGAASGAPDRLAYVSYTSGSTGKAKGVAVPHRAVVRLLHGADWIDIRQKDVFLELAPVAFDASTIEIWAPLMNGARLVVLPGPPAHGDQIRDAVQREGVTVLLLATGLFMQMMSGDTRFLTTLRQLLIGGDRVSPRWVLDLLAAFPRLVFTNGYGPTENTSFTTCWSGHRLPDDGTVPIGTAIRGTRIAVLDPRLNPVADGEVGELYASGAGLARGYIGRPAATAERFVADSDPSRPGSRMYRTGDLVRRRADGSLDFVGRADQQVKVRGFRVEPAQVEAVMIAHPAVRDAIVVTQTAASGERRLVGYVVPSGGSIGGHTNFGAAVKAFLHEKLPGYMVPWAVVACSHFPLDRNGKVDRKALPSVQNSTRNIDQEFVAPRNNLEDRLAKVWADVLDVEPVGVLDDFFDLGGHSLLAARALAAMSAELAVTVPARLLYEHRTIGQLAAALPDILHSRAQDAVVSTDPRS